MPRALSILQIGVWLGFQISRVFGSSLQRWKQLHTKTSPVACQSDCEKFQINPPSSCVPQRQRLRNPKKGTGVTSVFQLNACVSSNVSARALEAQFLPVWFRWISEHKRTNSAICGVTSNWTERRFVVKPAGHCKIQAERTWKWKEVKVAKAKENNQGNFPGYSATHQSETRGGISTGISLKKRSHYSFGS